jgi:hypothetical protein
MRGYENHGPRPRGIAHRRTRPRHRHRLPPHHPTHPRDRHR